MFFQEKHNTKQTIKKKLKKTCTESYNLIDGSLKEKKTTLRYTILSRESI